MKKILTALSLAFSMASAQDAPHSHDLDQSSPPHDMAGMEMNMDEHAALTPPSPHEGSGTAWQPASVSGHEWMWMPGGWELMAHGVVFLDYNQQGGPRGVGKAESVNWGMLMEQHRRGSGTILFSQMFSAGVTDLATSRIPATVSDRGPITARPWWIISIRITCLPNSRRCTGYRSARRCPGNFMADLRLNRHWGR